MNVITARSLSKESAELHKLNRTPFRPNLDRRALKHFPFPTTFTLLRDQHSIWYPRPPACSNIGYDHCGEHNCSNRDGNGAVMLCQCFKDCGMNSFGHDKMGDERFWLNFFGTGYSTLQSPVPVVFRQCYGLFARFRTTPDSTVDYNYLCTYADHCL